MMQLITLWTQDKYLTCMRRTEDVSFSSFIMLLVGFVKGALIQI